MAILQALCCEEAHPSSCLLRGYSCFADVEVRHLLVEFVDSPVYYLLLVFVAELVEAQAFVCRAQSGLVLLSCFLSLSVV